MDKRGPSGQQTPPMPAFQMSMRGPTTGRYISNPGWDSLSPQDALTRSSTASRQFSPPGSPPDVSPFEHARLIRETMAYMNARTSDPGHPPGSLPRYVESTPNLPRSFTANTSSHSQSANDVATAAPITKSYSAPVIQQSTLRVKPEKRSLLKAKMDRVIQKFTPRVDWPKLPTSAFECVLDQLRLMHVSTNSASCTTCYMRDLCALQTICRAWELPVQTKLYSNIEILGAEDPLKIKKTRIKYGARLTLLRRTLRSRPMLASLVEGLHVPDPIIPLYLANGGPNPEYDEYVCLLASVVQACPNLRTFDGFYPFYNHTFDRLTHALSTRLNLKQHVWIIAENDDVNERAQKQLAGLLDVHQRYEFVQYHHNWSKLETLMLCSPASLGVIEHDLFLSMFRSLPALRHLCVSSFDADDFNNDTLIALPKLRTLRLEECSGITDAGLTKWAASPATIMMENLSLIHQNVVSLITIAKIFAGLIRLRRFSILQTDASPDVPLDMAILQPLLASETLQFMHWDIGEDNSSCRSPTEYENVDLKELKSKKGLHPNIQLALSIAHRGFPALTHLRAPRDLSSPGVLQSVCRPVSNGLILLPADKFSMARMYTAPNSNSLQIARIRAQDVIDRHAHKKKEWMKVVVTDHSELPPIVRPPLSASTAGSRETTRTTSTAFTEPDEDGHEALLEYSRTSEDWSEQMLPTPLARTYSDSDTTERGPSALERRRTNSSGSPTRLNRPASAALSPIMIPSPTESDAIFEPPTIHEFVLPTFVGRVSIHIADNGQVFHPPKFHLLPDISGHDGNGGLAGWGELLRVSERAKMSGGSVEAEDEMNRNSCDGSWNKWNVSQYGTGKRSDSKDKSEWWHTSRQRVRPGMRVRVQDFF